MLNKIKLIGRFLPPPSLKTKEKPEAKELKIYFSLEVTNPSDAITVLRCVARGEVAKRIEEELQENDIIEVFGYLRNEWHHEKKNEEEGEKNLSSDQGEQKVQNRQILTKVTEFTKLNISLEEIDQKSSNQVRLIGKVITDFVEIQEERKRLGKSELLTFKLAVPREKNPSPLFFCRVQEKELINEFNQRLKKGDIILLEGFLQSKKQKMQKVVNGQTEEEVYSTSAIICQGFTLLDSDFVSVFKPLEKFNRVFVNIKRKSFSLPESKN